MENEEIEQHYVGVRFEENGKNYNFLTNFRDLKIGDLVVCDTINGEEIGIVATKLFPIKNYKSELVLREILRKPNRVDLEEYAESLQMAKEALKVAEEEIKKLGLPMKLGEASYSLEMDRCTITFYSENRVDFRELVRNLASALHCRIELRQVAPRDKAKIVGGIGLCGLPLCCSTFLTEFDGISISRAKNQMLSLNIPKISGHCGKLMCCLLFEDDMYTEEKRKYPRIGSVIHLSDGDFTVSSFNILSSKVKLENGTDIREIPLAELMGEKDRKEKPVQKEEPKPFQFPSDHRDEKPRNENRNNNQNPNRNPNQNQGNNQNNQNQNRNRHHNRHHYHGKPHQNGNK